MKKIICALLSLVLLCSCSSHKNVRVVNRGLSYKAHIFYYDKEYELLCDVYEDGAKYLCTSGKIEGFGAEVTKNGMTVYYSDMKKEIKTDGSVFSVLYMLTKFFDGDAYSSQEDGGNYYVDGQTTYGKFRYYFTPAGLPLSVTFENGDFSAEFSYITLQKS